MRLPVLLALTVSAACYGQQGGNILHPGLPPRQPGAITDPTFARLLGANVGGHGVPLSPPRTRHQHGSGVVVVPYPVYYGNGYGYGYEAPPPPQNQDEGQVVDANGAPSVIINQGFVPPNANPVVRDYSNLPDTPQPDSGMRLYQGPQRHPYADAQDEEAASQRRAPRNDDTPTLYLLAFKDHTIVQALGYWMESGNLHYVSAEHTLNQVSPNLIDRDLTQRLNDERGVEFKMPR